MPTYPISFTTKAAATERLTLDRRQTAIESSFTYATTIVNSDARWSLEWTWPRMTFAQAEVVSAWIISLRGQTGTFRYAPRQRYASSLTGRTLSLASFSQNNSIRVGGWSANAASTLRAGQFFQLGDQLLRIVSAPANATSSGTVDVEFEPALRKGSAIGTVVNFTSPTGIFRMNSADGMGYTLDPDKTPEFGSMSAKEVVA